MAAYVREVGDSPDVVADTMSNPAYNPDSVQSSYNGEARKRYRYHDRGDGVYDKARHLAERPHLVLTGEYVPTQAQTGERSIGRTRAWCRRQLQTW